MFHRDACHREIQQRNSRDQRFPREACFDLGNVKVEKDSGIFNEEGGMKRHSWRMDLRLNAARCFSVTHATESYQRNTRDTRLPREACFGLGDAKVEKDIVTFNEEDDENTLVEEGP